MIFVVIALVSWMCTAATWAPLRAGAACTPATHRARQGLAVACAALAGLGFARFVYFVVLHGHRVAQASVILGQAVALTLAVQAVVLWRGVFPRRGLAVALGLWCAAIGVRAAVEAVHRLA